MFRSRKAMTTFSLLLIVIVGVLTRILIILLFYKIAEGAEEQAYQSRCKSSMMAYAKINSLPFGEATADPADIECPTRFMTIEKNSPLAMKRGVANLMFECWNNYGEGKIVLFRATDLKFCAICSVFQFEDKSIKLDNFISFLRSEKAPIRTKEGYSPTYFDYIASYQTSPGFFGADDPTKNLDLNYLDGSKRYAVLFTFYKVGFWKKTWNAIGGFVVGAVVTVALAGPGVAVAAITGGTATPFVVLGITAAVAATTGAVVGAKATSAADWEARLILAEYSQENLKALSCEELPISMVDKRFR